MILAIVLAGSQLVTPVAPLDGPLIARRCLNRNVTIHGTPGDDKVLGSPGSDVIKAGRGDDLVIGGGGQDFLCGNRGADVLVGGEGTDTANGGRGEDACVAERQQKCEGDGAP